MSKLNSGKILAFNDSSWQKIESDGVCKRYRYSEETQFFFKVALSDLTEEEKSSSVIMVILWAYLWKLKLKMDVAQSFFVIIFEFG